MVSTPAPAAISHIHVFGHETYAAVGSNIAVYQRAKIVRSYESVLGQDRVVAGLCGVGQQLFVYDDSNNIAVCIRNQVHNSFF